MLIREVQFTTLLGLYRARCRTVGQGIQQHCRMDGRVVQFTPRTAMHEVRNEGVYQLAVL